MSVVPNKCNMEIVSIWQGFWVNGTTDISWYIWKRPCNAQRFLIEMVTVERQSYGSFLSNSPYKADDVDRDLISLPFGRILEPEEVVFD